MKPVMFCHASAAMLALILSGTASTGASAYTLTTLHSFCAKADCTDGKSPEGGLVMDASGNLYGTTFYGGKNGCGTIYELLRPTKSTRWSHKVLHSLCAAFTPKDGELPISRLVLDVNGNLYGTTLNGGAQNAGAAFRLSANADRSKWSYGKIADLCIRDGCRTNVGTLSFGLAYRGASSGVPYDGVSPLYGQNENAGRFMLGTVFELSPVQGKTRWRARNIHTFCNKNGYCPDGSFPDGALTMDSNGRLFGAAEVGGTYSVGTIFEARPEGKADHWKTSAIYAFCQNDCADGSGPNSELLKDSAGNLYGTAGSSGDFCPVSNCGVLFKLNPDGAQPQYSVLHRFCTEQGCPDGAAPGNSLLIDSSGAIYGVTGQNPGTVYRAGTSFETLYTFCAQANCTDGEYPAGMVMDAAGHIFGITAAGGAYGQGTVFELSP